MATDANGVNVEAKRGRKPGTRGVSKDFAAFLALDDVDFGAFLQRADFNSGQWNKDIKLAVIEALRYGDDPVF